MTSKIREIGDILWNQLNIDNRLSQENKTTLRVFIVIIWLLTLVIGGVFGFYLDKYLSDLNKRADAYAFLNHIETDEYGVYIPITLMNTGDLDITRATIALTNCYSAEKDYAFFELLPPGQQVTLKIRNDILTNLLQSNSCDPVLVNNSQRCEIRVFIDDQKDLVVPPTNCTKFFCGICPYSISIQSIALNKTINYSMTASFPQKIEYYSMPTKTITNLTYLRSVWSELTTPLETCLKTKECLDTGNEDDTLYRPILGSPLNISFDISEGKLNLTIQPLPD